jgi:hypothetical protein
MLRYFSNFVPLQYTLKNNGHNVIILTFNRLEVDKMARDEVVICFGSK